MSLSGASLFGRGGHFGRSTVWSLAKATQKDNRRLDCGGIAVAGYHRSVLQLPLPCAAQTDDTYLIKTILALF